uniref:Uncharacterized protein n=1 Tax=Rhizophora mucronata TaxID=61149 RepID=A0A2P2MBA4_RHIMU
MIALSILDHSSFSTSLQLLIAFVCMDTGMLNKFLESVRIISENKIRTFCMILE